MQEIEEIFSRLDLGEYLQRFSALLAREKPLFMQGDSKIHFENITELAKYQFDAPQSAQKIGRAHV